MFRLVTGKIRRFTFPWMMELLYVKNMMDYIFVNLSKRTVKAYFDYIDTEILLNVMFCNGEVSRHGGFKVGHCLLQDDINKK